MNYYNQKTRITASVIGVLLGIAGLVNHGFFEVLQGNTPANGFFIEAISEANRYWVHGTQRLDGKGYEETKPLTAFMEFKRRMIKQLSNSPYTNYLLVYNGLIN